MHAGMTVLIIDDEATLVRNLATYLRRKGHEVRTAANAEDGLAVLAHFRPAVVLCDHELPGMSGLEAVRRIHRTHAGIRVVMLSGCSGVELADAARAAGAVAFVSKPLELGEVQRMLEHLKAT